VSDFTRRELLRRCPLPAGRAVVLHNALDPFFAIDAGAPPATCPPIIVTVTRLTKGDRYKGVEQLIAAMPAVLAAEPAAHLRIIGQGDDKVRLMAIARNLGLLGKSVTFLGFVDDERLVEELRGCRLFALPSGREGFGLVFLEAMALGRPCLGARAGGIPEVIAEDTGILVEYGNTAALAEGCIAGLRREWRQEPILARARAFSFGPFKAQLASLLAESAPSPS